MRRPDLGRTLYGASFVAVVAALTHFIVLLALPSAARRDAYARVAELTTPFVTVAAPAADDPRHAFPYLDPTAAAAFCRYDLSGGPVRVIAPQGDAAFASLSFHSRRGVVFYALTDRAASKGRMEALIVTPDQLRALVARDDEDNPSQDLRVVSPTTEGFVLARALSASPDRLNEAATQARAMSCAPEPLGEAEK